MRLMRQLLIGLLVLGFCVVLIPIGSNAETIVHTATVSLASTNWNQTMTFPKFDLAPNCLLSVCFELRGHAEGTAKFESLDPAPTTVNMNLQATITLQRPDASTLVTVIPLANTSDAVTAFDGTIDFGGTSGKTYSDLSGDDVETFCTIMPADLALFSGSGNIVLPVVALGTSNGSGAGNLILQFGTLASSEVIVTYTYHCEVPTQITTWGQIKSLY